MSPADVARRHHAERKRVIRAAERAGVRAWRQVDRDAIGASWSSLSPGVRAALVAAQTQAAGQAEGYTAAMLAELGIDADPAGEVVPEAFAGESADGRSLRTLLLTPQVAARSGLSRGQSLPQAMASGQAALQLMLRTEVADAGRVADGVTVAARPGVGYVRLVTPPSCPRCAILAGRVYRYSQGFQRHPGCDCLMQPATGAQAEGLVDDPQQLFRDGQIRGLSKADTQAISDGADMNQVINARRGMYSADGGRKLTREGTTRRGLASKRIREFDPSAPETERVVGRRGAVAEFTERRVTTRLRPETIYREASSRDEAITMLRLNGYIR